MKISSFPGLVTMVAAVAIGAPTSLPAQIPELTEVLVPGEGVRLRVETDRIVEGTVEAISRDSVILDDRTRRIAVARSAVTRVWTREPAYRTGARVGAISGSLLFGASGTLLFYGTCESSDCGFDARVPLVGATLGLVFGTLTGGILGTLSDEWIQRYP